MIIWFTDPQRTDPEYLKNVDFEHLFGWFLPSCLYHSNIQDLSPESLLSIYNNNKKKPNKGPIVTSFFRFKIFYVHKIRFFLTLMTKNAKMVKNQLSNWNEKFLKIILLKVFWLNLCTFKILIISVQPKNKNIEKFNPDNFWSNSCSGHI